MRKKENVEAFWHFFENTCRIPSLIFGKKPKKKKKKKKAKKNMVSKEPKYTFGSMIIK